MKVMNELHPADHVLPRIKEAPKVSKLYERGLGEEGVIDADWGNKHPHAFCRPSRNRIFQAAANYKADKADWLAVAGRVCIFRRSGKRSAQCFETAIDHKIIRTVWPDADQGSRRAPDSQDIGPGARCQGRYVQKWREISTGPPAKRLALLWIAGFRRL